MDISVLFLSLVVCVVSGGAGYWAGWTQARRDAEQEADRLQRFNDYGQRTAGAPTNLGLTPSRVSKGKIRQRRRWDLH